jgi:hypothetical protein
VYKITQFNSVKILAPKTLNLKQMFLESVRTLLLKTDLRPALGLEFFNVNLQ